VTLTETDNTGGGGKSVIVAEADLELSTALVAVRLIVCSVVTVAGAM
jgi:hypothetical protein